MPFLFQRIVEYSLSQILPSLFFAIFLQNGAKEPSASVEFAVMAVCIVLNIIYLLRCLVEYWLYAKKTNVYYKVNIVAFIIFMVVNIIMAVLLSDSVYTHLFFQYKILTLLGVHKIISALVIHAIMFTCIVALPKLIRINFSYWL